MDLHRIIPNLTVDDPTTGHEFYEEFLGPGEAVRHGLGGQLPSPSNPSIQVTPRAARTETAPEQSSMSVAVADVDAAYAEAQRRGYEIVHPLTHEPWGVRRFFVRDPHGVVVNVVGHAD